jgi:uncharacterized protein
MIDMPHRLRDWFIGPTGPRAGWRLLLALGFFELLIWIENVTLKPRLEHADDVEKYIVFKAANLVALLIVSAIMARLERRSIAIYGLPARRALRGEFWRGVFGGLAAITVLLTAMRVVSVFDFGRIALHGAQTLEYAIAFALVFLLVGVQEEFKYRGYGLYTLTTGIGFWPAALISVLFFGAGHIPNHGENFIGVMNVCLGAMLFCLMLRRTGNLWMPIGVHAAWDFGQSVLYGVPDSGYLLPGRLFESHFKGPAWLTGGTAGPEGSVLCTALIIALWFAISAWLPVAKYPLASAAADDVGGDSRDHR